MPTLSTVSDKGGGGVKSPEAFRLKTDGPLCVNFRRIKQGGYTGDGIFSQNIILQGQRGKFLSAGLLGKTLFKGLKTA